MLNLALGSLLQIAEALSAQKVLIPGLCATLLGCPGQENVCIRLCCPLGSEDSFEIAACL